jgi:hypothetical protein
MNGGNLHTERLSQVFAAQPVGARFMWPITQDGDEPSFTVDHRDLVPDARDQLEQTDSEPAEDSNQRFPLIESRGRITAGVHYSIS